MPWLPQCIRDSYNTYRRTQEAKEDKKWEKCLKQHNIISDEEKRKQLEEEFPDEEW